MYIDMNDIPETITVDLVAYISDSGFISFWHDGPACSGYTAISPPITVKFAVYSREQITGGLVEDLRKEQKELVAKSEYESNKIEQKIQSMLAIGYDGDKNV